MSLLGDLGTKVGAEFKSHRLRLENIETNVSNIYTKSEVDAKIVELSPPADLSTVYTQIEVNNLLGNKIDKVVGKGLSTEDYTTAEKTKLSLIQQSTMDNTTIELSSSESVFNLTYTVGMISVYMNGMKLRNNIDYVANNGTSIILNEPANIGDIIDVTTYNAVVTENSYTKIESDNLLGNKVDKVTGKGLSTEDYTTAEKTKLASLNNYTLPIASTTVLGGVKAGNNITIDANGVLSANVGSLNWSGILGKPSTLSGYGITDAYTKTEVESKIAELSPSTDISMKADITYVDSKINDIINLAPATLDTLGEIATQLTVDAGAVTTLTTIVNNKADKATTLSGYNISDAYTKTQTNNQIGDAINNLTVGTINTLVDTLNNKVDKVTGKGLSTEDYTTAEKTKLASLNNYTLPIASTTVLGGVKAGANINIDSFGVISTSVGSTNWTDILGKPTTLAGYGISDAQPKLVSGTNIKTINGATLMGSGDLLITGSSTVDPDKVVTKLYGATGIVDLSKHLMIKDDLITIPSSLTPYQIVSGSTIAYITMDYNLVCNGNTLNIKSIDSDTAYIRMLSNLYLQILSIPSTSGSEYTTDFLMLSIGAFCYILDLNLVVKYKISALDYGITTVGRSAVMMPGSMGGNAILAIGQPTKILFFSIDTMSYNIDLSTLTFDSELSNPDNTPGGLFGYVMLYINNKLFISDSNYNSAKGKVYVFNKPYPWSQWTYVSSISFPNEDISSSVYFGSDLFTDITGLYLFISGSKKIYRYRIATSLTVPEKTSFYYANQSYSKLFNGTDVSYCDGKYIYIKMNNILSVYDLKLDNIYNNTITSLVSTIRSISSFGIIMYGSGLLTYNKFKFITPKLAIDLPKVITSPNGTKYALAVSDTGVISTEIYKELNYNYYSQNGTYYPIYWSWDASTYVITPTSMTGLELSSDYTSLLTYKDFYVSIKLNNVLICSFDTTVTDANDTSVTMHVPIEVVSYFDKYKNDIGFVSSDGMSSNLQNVFRLEFYRKSNAVVASSINEGLWF